MTRPPGWFWLGAIALLAWNIIGLVALLFDPMLGLGHMAKLPPDQQALYAARPVYAFVGFVLATVAGTAGAAALLLLRPAIAAPLFVLSLIGLMLQNAWLFAQPDRLTGEVVGFVGLVALTILIALWLCRVARQRGWSS